MSHQDSLMAAEDEAFVRRVLTIMIVWTIVVVAAGLVLVVVRDPFASVFAFAAMGM